MRQEQKTEYNKKWSQIIAKAASDPAFKQTLIEKPKSVAAEHGISIPPGVDIQVVENAPTVVRIVLTSRQTQGALSDEQLEDVAGGTVGRTPRPGGTNFTAPLYEEYSLDADGSLSLRTLENHNPENR